MACQAFWPSQSACSGNGECVAGKCACSPGWSSAGDFRSEPGVDCDIHLDVVRGLYAALAIVWLALAVRIVGFIYPAFRKSVKSNGWEQSDRIRAIILLAALLSSLLFGLSGALRAKDPDKRGLGQDPLFTITFSLGMASFWCLGVTAVSILMKLVYHKQEQNSLLLKQPRKKKASKFLSGNTTIALLILSTIIQNLVSTLPTLLFPKFTDTLVIVHYAFASCSIGLIYHLILGPAIFDSMERSLALHKLLDHGISQALQTLLEKLELRRKFEGVFLRELRNQYLSNMTMCALVGFWPFFRHKVTYLLPLAWAAAGFAVHLCLRVLFFNETVSETRANRNEPVTRLVKLSKADERESQLQVYQYFFLIINEIFSQSVAWMNFFSYAAVASERGLVDFYSLFYAVATILSLFIGAYVVGTSVLSIVAFRTEMRNGVPVQLSRYRKFIAQNHTGALLENRILILERALAKAKAHVATAVSEDVIMLSLAVFRLFWTDTFFTQSFVGCISGVGPAAACMQGPQRLVFLQVVFSSVLFTYNLGFSREMVGLRRRLNAAQHSLDQKIKQKQCELDLFTDIHQGEVEDVVAVRQNVAQDLSSAFHSGINTNLQVLRLLRKEQGSWLRAAHGMLGWLRAREVRDDDEIRRSILLGGVSFPKLLENYSATEAARCFGWQSGLAVVEEHNCIVLFGQLDVEALYSSQDPQQVFAAVQCAAEWLMVALDGLSERDRRVYDLVLNWQLQSPGGERLSLHTGVAQSSRELFLSLPLNLYHAGPAAEQAVAIFGGQVWSNSIVDLTEFAHAPHTSTMESILGRPSSELALQSGVSREHIDCVIQTKVYLQECLFRARDNAWSREDFEQGLVSALQTCYVVFMDSHSKEAADHAFRIQAELTLAKLVAGLERPIYALQDFVSSVTPHFSDVTILNCLQQCGFAFGKGVFLSAAALDESFREHKDHFFLQEHKKKNRRRSSTTNSMEHINRQLAKFESTPPHYFKRFFSSAKKKAYRSVTPSSLASHK